MIYIAGISIAFLLSLLLLTKKGKTQADHILTCWLLVIGVHLLLFYLYVSGLSYRYPWTLALGMPLPLVHGPLLLLYTASLTNQLNAKKRVWLLHFIPAATSWIYLTRFYSLPAEQKVYIFQNNGIGFESFTSLNLAGIVLSGITYVVWSQLLLRKHRKAILDEFSDTEKINLNWLRYLIYGIAFIWLLIFASDETLYAGVVAFVFFMGYFGIRQPGIFTHHHSHGRPSQPPVQQDIGNLPPGNNNPGTPGEMESIAQGPVFSEPQNLGQELSPGPQVMEEDPGKRKYSKSGLTPAMAGDLHRRLTQLMDKEKLFTETELSLSDLASRLETLPNYLSQVINEKEGKTFYDYINSLRIEEFKKLVSEPANKKYTLLSLSFECGFNSKSSFNKNFKKATGISPSEYLEQMNFKAA
jgi:AraC-like DNA-binding protein